MTYLKTSKSPETADTINFILRGQPQHKAHEETMEYAASRCGVLNLVYGSANQPRDEDNPFYQEERIEVGKRITANFKQKFNCDVNFVSVENSMYNNTQWAKWVDEAVKPYCNGTTRLIGHNKDETSFYLHMFPQWGKPILTDQFDVLDATTIRDLYFSKKNNLDFFRNVCPDATMSFLEEFMRTPDYDYICEEAAFIKNYIKQFDGYPYPPIFQTGDSIVVKDGHFLMGQRNANPGKNLDAWPGGYMNAKTYTKKNGEVIKADISVVDCSIRELIEEVKIKVSEKILRKNIIAEKRFDHPKRDRRGRIITTTQLILLDDPDIIGLPPVKGRDDLRSAGWKLRNDIKRRNCYSDHYDQLLWAEGVIAARGNH